jgi:hypothetical protein
MKRYFFDTEFIEHDRTIDLISIGIVCDDGREYYAVNSECDYLNASPWVWANVLHPMGLDRPILYVNPTDPGVSVQTKETLRHAKPHGVISEEVKLFLTGSDRVEFWADYASYDWVVFCWLFGKMMELPKGLPMYCNDIQQEANRIGGVTLPAPLDAHNALSDARNVFDRWKVLAAADKR